MDPITFMVFAAIWLGTQAFLTNALEAQEEARILKENATAKAEHAKDTAAAQLDADVGQLGQDFDTYDDWYSAQQAEFTAEVAGGYGGSWEEYLVSQQTTELGTLGRRRAQLESDVGYAEDKLGQARVDTELHHEFGLRQHQAGTDESNRMLRNEASAAAASGFRSGTPQTTVAENTRVRSEALQLYLDRITASRDSNLASIATSEAQLQSNEGFALAGLDAALTGARSGFDLNIAGIDLDLGQFTAGVNREVARQQSLGSYVSHLFGAGGAVFSVFGTGLDVGAWGFDKAGQFWTMWDQPSVSGIGGGPKFGGGTPSLRKP